METDKLATALLQFKNELKDLVHENSLMLQDVKSKVTNLETRVLERLDKLEEEFSLHQHVVSNTREEFHALDKKIVKVEDIPNTLDKHRHKITNLEQKAVATHTTIEAMEETVSSVQSSLAKLADEQTKDTIKWQTADNIRKIALSKPVLVIFAAGLSALATKFLGVQL